jgi:hypothetical protein
VHTLVVIGIGMLVLGLLAALGRIAGGHDGLVRALLVFLPVWFIGAAINMLIGVKGAGYSAGDEAPVFVVVFVVPAAVALYLWSHLLAVGRVQAGAAGSRF